MLVKLTHDDQCLAEKVGLERYRYYEKRGLVTLYGRSKERGPEANYVDAMGAEIAFCRTYGVEPMLSPNEGRHYDAILVGPDGLEYTVDVKNRDTQFGPMNIKRKDHPSRTPHLFAFVVGALPHFRIAGFIWATEALQEKYMDRYAEHPCYKIPQSALTELPW